ncbi:glutathione S-transferase family protein [Thalassovita taeanensis]|uniref:Glutathione S-transferase n=1 Tax=Thalassovita taeanensis TaxID=657014 RepID=A0A1H9BCT1_9RHOB|nr:glutathione S-transferase family protein [Thalassovita taeanensis]SEP86068.1 Glutathione S-transferase [Thalassovita taeanensis]
MIELWHCADARSFRALWALEELGLEYELKMLQFPPRVFKKDYLAENPLGTIPLLVDGDTRMTESAAIAHYLAMRHGGGKFTPAPQDATYGAYLNWLHHGEATLTFPQTIYLRYTFLEQGERRSPQVAEDYKKWFLARLRLLEQTLGDGRMYLLGDEFSMADISVGYAILLAHSLHIEDELPPLTVAWYARLTQRPAFVAAQAKQREAAAAQGVEIAKF